MKAGYDRSGLQTGIVHLGVGAFHRAHQAVYTDAVLRRSGGAWGICGVSLRSDRVRNALAEHDNLYSLQVRAAEGTRIDVVGALTRILVAPEQPAAVVAAIAKPNVHVVTLTVTEKGYCLSPASGTLDRDHPDIAHDLRTPDTPRSAIGYLLAGLKERKRQGSEGITLISCDNLASNGIKLRDAVLDFANATDTELAGWISSRCTFPNSMVDRIVPATSDSDLNEAERLLGEPDPATVVTEPFSQWVIERKFAGPVPAWDQVGVEFVDNVAPYEHMKLRLLNASHSSMAYLGCLAGYETVHEVIGQNSFERMIRQLMGQEMAPTLADLSGFDLSAYQQSLIDRFSNSNLPHRTRQIAMDGSQKIAQRLLPAISERLAQNLPCEAAICSLAGWIRYSTGVDEAGHTYPVDDPLSADFSSHYEDADGNLEIYLDRLLKMRSVFPAALAESARLRRELLAWLQAFQQAGVQKTISERWGNPA